MQQSTALVVCTVLVVGAWGANGLEQSSDYSDAVDVEHGLASTDDVAEHGPTSTLDHEVLFSLGMFFARNVLPIRSIQLIHRW